MTDRSAKAIERAAADWLVQREAGLSTQQEAALARWLAADERHAQCYRSLERAWGRLDTLRDSSEAADLEAELDEEIARATAEPRVIRWQAWVVGAMAACFVGLLAYFAVWRPWQARAPYAERAATMVGEVRSLKMPDGSTIRLNTDSSVEVLFTATERRVRLNRGEAYFQVAKNPARPFVVCAAGVDVRAIGTEFDVRLHSAALEVTVSEGRVRVDHSASGESLLSPPATAVASDRDRARNDPPLLVAGERVIIPVEVASKVLVTSAARVNIAPVEIQRSLAWHEGRLVFESATLADMVAEFNRYNRRKLVIANPELAERRFGGTFVAGDANTFLELLRETHDVVTEEQPERTVIRLRK